MGQKIDIWIIFTILSLLAVGGSCYAFLKSGLFTLPMFIIYIGLAVGSYFFTHYVIVTLKDLTLKV